MTIHYGSYWYQNAIWMQQRGICILGDLQDFHFVFKFLFFLFFYIYIICSCFTLLIEIQLLKLQTRTVMICILIVLFTSKENWILPKCQRQPSCIHMRNQVQTIEYGSDDITKNFVFAFQCFEYHISIEYDEKPPQPKFGGNWFMGVWDMAAWKPIISPIEISANWTGS